MSIFHTNNTLFGGFYFAIMINTNDEYSTELSTKEQVLYIFPHT